MKLAEFLTRSRITPRQADYWARTGLFECASNPGSGQPRSYTREDVRRALIAKEISAIAGGSEGSFAHLAAIVLAAIRLADTTDTPYVAISADRNLHALHSIAADMPGTAVLVLSCRPDVDAYLQVGAS